MRPPEDDFSPPRNLNETVALTSSPTRLMPPRLFTWIFCNSNDNALRTSALRKVFLCERRCSHLASRDAVISRMYLFLSFSQRRRESRMMCVAVVSKGAKGRAGSKIGFLSRRGGRRVLCTSGTRFQRHRNTRIRQFLWTVLSRFRLRLLLRLLRYLPRLLLRG